ncbi:MAG: tetratricopeptide repeat protein [Ignavibacteriaceae bacterium]
MAERDKQIMADEHFEIAHRLHLKGKIEDAIAAYKISIELHPTAKAHTFLGWAYSLQGRYEEAINECYKAIELDPQFGNPYNDVGSYLIRLDRHDDAIEWLERAIEAEDYEPRHYPFYNLGMVYEKRGDWFTAMKYYNEALELNPEYETAQTAVLRLTTLLN